MWMTVRIATAGVIAVLLSALWAVPASADAGDDPCALAVTFLCRFMPIAPDLDGDVDLTTAIPPAEPATAPQPWVPPDLCAAGCV
jgi:hypothetical protein